MREMIITEASRLFAEHGIKATTIARIESAVGLRPGSGGVHRYFATKDDLVRAVLEAQLAKGTETREVAGSWPLPDPEHLLDFLRQIGHFALAESEHGREVALIGFREGRRLYEKFPDLKGRNFELAFASVADAIRAMENAAGVQSDLDPEVVGFLFMGPLIYHRIIEWVSGETALGIDDDRLIEQWARIMERVFRPLIERAGDATAES